jgi:hypothetical protein
MTLYPTVYYGLVRKARPEHVTREPSTVYMGKRPTKGLWDPFLHPQELLLIQSTLGWCSENDEGDIFLSEEQAEVYYAMRSLLDDLMNKGEEIQCVLQCLILTKTGWHSPYLS